MLILIVDSSVPVIERLINLITESEMVATTYHATSYDEAVMVFNKMKPDTVLLDMSLPENRSIDLLREIKLADTGAAVIALSNSDDQQMLEHCLFWGADYCFDKYHDYEKIPATIIAMDAGK